MTDTKRTETKAADDRKADDHNARPVGQPQQYGDEKPERGGKSLVGQPQSYDAQRSGEDVEREDENRRAGQAMPQAAQAGDAEDTTVESLQWHTHLGEAHDIGDVYDAEAEYVDSLVAQGKVRIKTDDDSDTRTQRRSRKRGTRE